MKMDFYAAIMMVAGMAIALGGGLLGTMLGMIDADTGRKLVNIGAGVAGAGLITSIVSRKWLK